MLAFKHHNRHDYSLLMVRLKLFLHIIFLFTSWVKTKPLNSVSSSQFVNETGFPVHLQLILRCRKCHSRLQRLSLIVLNRQQEDFSLFISNLWVFWTFLSFKITSWHLFLWEGNKRPHPSRDSQTLLCPHTVWKLFLLQLFCTSMPNTSQGVIMWIQGSFDFKKQKIYAINRCDKLISDRTSIFNQQQ